jgi:hypothetical protein
LSASRTQFADSASPQKNPRASHGRIFISAGDDGFETNVATHDRFQLPLPLIAKSTVGSKRRVVFTGRGHESDGKIDITLRA